MSTIKDVARMAGVSIATVSRTLAEPDKVAPETQRKVQAAIKKSGYVRNALARSFRMQSTQTILVLVPDIGNPFYSLIIQGLEEVAQFYQYRILLGDTQNDTKREAEYLNSVHRQIDGVISLCHTLPKLQSRRAERQLPIVMACEYLHDKTRSLVSIDNVTAARQATEHLLALGHKRIALINGPSYTPLSKDRLRGYLNALKAAGVAENKDLIIRGDFSLKSGEEVTHTLLASQKKFTAVFCANDAMAIGAIKVLRQSGLSVPDDISVVGFDDIEFSQYVEPALTTIHQPRKEIGQAAMQNLIDALSSSKRVATQTVLPHELVVRSSTAPCKRP